MASTLPTRGFISYSRSDSDFVDRLEADLRARGFETWVDRRRLEGAQNWEQEIFRGIDWCSLMVVVLSPSAVTSSAVEQEWRYALSKNKLIIPLLWRDCHIPSELEKIQYVDFHIVDYTAGLKTLLIAIADRADQRTSLPTDSRELYKQAIEARQHGDLERAAILLQRLVDRDAGYAGGEPARDLAAVNDRLYAGRAQHLRQEAIDARSEGEYGREAGALEALVSLAPEDAWANEYLPIAQTNRRYLDLYAAIQHLIEIGDLTEARDKLTRLWQDAPYFRDPADIAPKLGLHVPPSFEETKERVAAEEEEKQQKIEAEHIKEQSFAQAAQERKRKQDNASRRYDQALQAEEARWTESSRNASTAINSGDPDDVLVGLIATEAGRRTSGVFRETKRLEADVRLTNLAAHRTKRQFEYLRAKAGKRCLVYLASGFAASIATIVVWLIYLNSYVPIGDQNAFFSVHHTQFDAINVVLANAIIGAGVVVAGLLYLSWLLLLPLAAIQLKHTNAHLQAVSQRGSRAEQDLQEERTRAYQQWVRVQGEAHSQKVEQIRKQHEQTLAEIGEWSDKLVATTNQEHRHRLAEIEAQYQRELADIARRYGSA